MGALSDKDNIKSLVELELARCCKELDEYVEATPVPLITLNIVKFRGTNVVTNFDVSRYYVEKIIESNSLLTGELARRTKDVDTTNQVLLNPLVIVSKIARNGTQKDAIEAYDLA